MNEKERGYIMQRNIGVFLVTLILMISLVLESNYVFADNNEITLVCESSVAPFAIFEQSEDVRFKVNVNMGTYTLTDYYGNILSEENFSDDEIVISGLSLGRYSITVSDGTNITTGAFSVVPDVDKRRDSSQSGFGLSAMSSHSYSSEDREEAYAKTIALAGVPYVREFCNGDEVNNSKSKLHKRYNKLLEEYHKQGIDVTFMFQKFPGEDTETGEGLEEGHELTRDMQSVYSLVKDICEQKGECIDVLEIENEVDVWLGDCDGPDLYAAFLKTASIAASDYSDDLLVSTAGFTDTKPHDYVEKFLSNGVAEYFDIYNVHHYKVEDDTKNIVEYPAELEEYMPKAEKYGLTEKMLWAGEYGLRFPYEENMDELTDTQQKQQARNVVTAFIEAQAAGVDKVFWFTHGYIYESSYGVYNGFGTMDQKHCPNMSYSSISALTNALGNAKYIGKITTDGTNVKAHCYADGATEIACVWAEESETISLAVNNGAVTLTDIMGNEEKIDVTDGCVTITAGPDIQYIRAENGFASDSVVESIKYSKNYKKSKLTNAQRIVMLPMFSVGAEAKARDKGYELFSTKDNDVTLKVYNFNDEAMSGTITATAPDGWSISTNEQNVDVEPMGCTELSFTLNKSGTTNLTKSVPLVFEGDFDGENTSPSVSYIGTSLTYDYAYSANLGVNSMSYDGETLMAELNGYAKDVKFLINGRTYTADITNNSATLKIVLPDGTHEINTSMFDTSGTAATSVNSITVSRDGAYTISYDANGGGAAPMPQLAQSGENAEISSERPYKHNAIFMGWATERFADMPQFNPGDTIEIEKDTVLYAVWKDGIEVEIVNSAIYNAEKAVIKGKTDINYAGKKATFVVFDSSASPDNLSFSDIVNVGETRIDLEGNYIIKFKVGNAGEYRYIINIGGEIIDSYMTEKTLIYDWLEKEIIVHQNGDTLAVTAEFDNYGDEDASVSLITGMYSEEGNLLDVHYEKFLAEPGMSGVGGIYQIPNDTAVKKIFLWSADGNLIPLCEPEIRN